MLENLNKIFLDSLSYGSLYLILSNKDIIYYAIIRLKYVWILKPMKKLHRLV